MKVSNIMTTGLIVAKADESVQEAARKMESVSIGVLPVVEEDGKVAGIVTDRDIVIRCVALGLSPHDTKLRTIMSKGAVTISGNEDVATAAKLMQKEKVRRLLVLDQTKNVAGIVSLGDLAVHGDQPALSQEVLEKVSQTTQATG